MKITEYGVQSPSSSVTCSTTISATFDVIRCTLDASQLSHKSDLAQQTSSPVYDGVAIQDVV